MTKTFNVGDKVRKTIGFPFNGTIVSEANTLANKTRYLVDNGHGMLHVHDPRHLTLDHPEYQYLDALKDCLENGVYREGRNGGTYSLFGRQMRFNLQEGFPLLTTKKLFTKGIVGELIWFISGDTNTKYLKDNGIKIWDQWEDENGDLGRIYGHQFTKWSAYNNWMDSVVLVDTTKKLGVNEPPYLDLEYVEPTFDEHSDDFVGREFSCNTGMVRVLSRFSKTRNGNSYYKAQFINTRQNGIIEVSRACLKLGQFKNPYHLVNGGCIGIIPESKKRKDYNRAYTCWANMMKRCHGDIPTKHYSEKGIFVDKRWRIFAQFYEDIQKIPGYEIWLNNPKKIHIDKDYYSKGYYGLDSVIFIPEKYNRYILPNNKGVKYIAIHKETHRKFEFTFPSAFYRKFNIKDTDLIARSLRLSNGNSKYWSFECVEPPKGKLYRQKFYINQIQEVIESIKTDPYSRRHIISTWNVGDLPHMALPPCHVLVQFYVAEGKLSCQLYQRSVDSAIGLPFNIASYALLTHMIAQETNLEVGDFVHTSGDFHIYGDQVEGVKELLTREPYPFPTLELPNKSMFDMEISDIKFNNYQAHPHIKMPVAT